MGEQPSHLHFRAVIKDLLLSIHAEGCLVNGARVKSVPRFSAEFVALFLYAIRARRQFGRVLLIAIAPEVFCSNEYVDLGETRIIECGRAASRWPRW